MAMKNAHHMTIYGCESPDALKPVYYCGYWTNLRERVDNTYCATDKHSQLLFSWSPGANGYMLPDDVGFKIGKGTKIEYIVLQVQYSKQLGGGGISGMSITFTQER